jgi:Rrf2 family transcriptional regulator, nitric oxide-sensitive transcriptional repressor
MNLTRFSDYSLRVLMYAAVQGDKPFSVQEVAAKFGLSRHHLAKVINRLVRLGHLKARRGRHGGVWLGQDPTAIRIGALVRLTENESPLVECFATEGNRCRLTPACRLKGSLAQALDAFYTSLDQQTLADLAGNRPALATLLADTAA